MATITINRLYRVNIMGDIAGDEATFSAINAQGKVLTRKVFGKVGAPDGAGEFKFKLGRKTVSVQCAHEVNVVCDWSAQL